MLYRIFLVLLFFYTSFAKLSALDFKSFLDSTDIGIKGELMDYRKAENQRNYYSIDNMEISLPDYFFDNDFLPTQGDNPLIHSSFWMDISLGFASHGFKFNTNLIAEHRGISYGALSKKHMIVFPKYFLSYDTDFSLFGEDFTFGVGKGNEDYLKKHEGLVISNMLFQGGYGYIGWNDLKFEYHQIGDLSAGIGLNLDERIDIILSAENIELNDDYSFSLRSGIFVNKMIYNVYYNDNDNTSSGLALSGSIGNENIRLYTEMQSITGSSFEDSYDFKYSTAFLFGFELADTLSDLRYSFSSEFRYYGYKFNQSIIEEDIDFGGGYWEEPFGRNVYPLSHFHRPFAQWAVFTEYQNRNVIGVILIPKIEYQISDNFTLFANGDINFIRASMEETFCYPFYNIGAKYSPVEYFFIQVSFMNSGINTERHYPTKYLYKKTGIFNSIGFKF